MRRAAFLLLLLLGLSVQAQEPQRLKVGLVLGGGGAKGAAHVGILRAIEQADIPIDYIAGTSIGSIVGGLYACGVRAEQLDTLFRSQRWMKLLTDSRSMTRHLPAWNP
ncbi:MAG: patatin-like phospholipase family protein, partial [Bacteroidaceae bacterium]|nr:patatin-like phospholipase family protein [Bacteroidaceae bacterium]